MNPAALLLASVLLTTPVIHPMAALDGGPPSIRLAGQASGSITAAQWSSLKAVELHGCVTGARIVSLTFCIKDCKGKDAMAGGESAVLTAYQHQMIRNLPPGMLFRVQAVVRDAAGRTWDVPEAHFIWKG
jgi:hypothetical protein